MASPSHSATNELHAHSTEVVSSAQPPAISKPERKPRKRLFYLDLVRALATCMIVLVHFNNPYLQPSSYLLTQQPFGIYLGGLGVSLFLIISGAALALTYQRPYSLKTFYWKRFKGIYPAFWIAWILGTLFFFLVQGGYPLNACSPKALPFTFLAIDGLLANFQVHTCYLLGEWFLGLILCFYVVFPILLWAIDSFPKITAVILVAIWAGTVCGGIHFGITPLSVMLPARIIELCFGMYFMKYFKRFPLWATLPALAVLAISGYYSEINEDIITPFVGIAAFVLIVQLSHFLDVQAVRVPVALISKYSYEIFLVHHVIIMYLYMKLPVYSFTGPYAGLQAWMLFACACVITFALAVALQRLTRACVGVVTQMFKRKGA